MRTAHTGRSALLAPPGDDHDRGPGGNGRKHDERRGDPGLARGRHDETDETTRPMRRTRATDHAAMAPKSTTGVPINRWPSTADHGRSDRSAGTAEKRPPVRSAMVGAGGGSSMRFAKNRAIGAAHRSRRRTISGLFEMRTLLPMAKAR